MQSPISTSLLFLLLLSAHRAIGTRKREVAGEGENKSRDSKWFKESKWFASDTVYIDADGNTQAHSDQPVLEEGSGNGILLGAREGSGDGWSGPGVDDEDGQSVVGSGDGAAPEFSWSGSTTAFPSSPGARESDDEDMAPEAGSGDVDQMPGQWPPQEAETTPKPWWDTEAPPARQTPPPIYQETTPRSHQPSPPPEQEEESKIAVSIGEEEKEELDNGDGVYETHQPSSFDPFLRPGILAAVIGGAVVGLLAAILLVMFIVYRMRKKDEGSYALEEPKQPPSYPYSYHKAPNKEFYA